MLGKALDAKGHKPVRLTGEMLKRLEEELPQDLGIDGTERKGASTAPPTALGSACTTAVKKCHTLKNSVVGGLEDRLVKYLGATHEGKKHDKKVCDEEATSFPDGTDLYRDTAYQGHELPNVTVHQPKKKPRNGKLPYEDRGNNRLISGIRVVIEHIIPGIKRSGIRCHADAKNSFLLRSIRNS